MRTGTRKAAANTAAQVKAQAQTKTLDAIVAQKHEERKRAARAMVLAGQVGRNGLDGQYVVESQSGRGLYLARARRITGGASVCGCLDVQGKANGGCKHILAAELFEKAVGVVETVADRHGLTLEQLEWRIICDLCGGVPSEEIADRLMIVLEVCRQLQVEQEQRERGEALPHFPPTGKGRMWKEAK